MTDLTKSYLPGFTFSYKASTKELHMAKISTGEQSCIMLCSFSFMWGSVWCLMPGGALCVTGGYVRGKSVKDVVRIDSVKDFAVTQMAPMISRRSAHGSVAYQEYLYVVGGDKGKKYSKECERYSFNNNCWESIGNLPSPCYGTTVVVLEATHSLYAIGGEIIGQDDDLILRLCLDDLNWGVLNLTLPSPANCLPCFTMTDALMYFVIQGSLYSFCPQSETIKQVKALSCDFYCFGPSYYYNGTLFCSNDNGAVMKIDIGRL